MTYSEFFNKYNIQFHIGADNEPGRLNYLKVLDDMYIKLTKEQALAMIEDYFNHADNIFNTVPNYLDQ